MNAKKEFFPVILICAGILFSIVMAEVLLSCLKEPVFYTQHEGSSQFTFVIVNNRILYYHNKPSERIRFVYENNPRGYFGNNNEIDHITNSWGFRGDEFSKVKPPQTFRIIFLGDSFTFGEGVKFDDTYPQKVSKLLRQHYKKLPLSFESYNFGVGGYNTVQESFLLTQIALQCDPDLVVIGYTLNDPEPMLFKYDEKENKVSRRAREFYIPEGLSQSMPPDSLWFRSRLAKLVWQAYTKIMLTHKMVAYYRLLFRENNDGWQKSNTALKEIIDICRERNIPCYVVIFPVLYQLNHGYPFTGIHESIRLQAALHGANSIDLLASLKGLAVEELWVYPTDQHPNEKVHRIAAESLAQAILANKEIEKKLPSENY
ncbi:MAG: SGNH/GDSL hydrolase family protein [Candidatus Omnitrophica bacterium]|nr:SGNH/GDSL hydrolase family protein [Candidatus Omnitrophota bacterium]